MSSFECIGAALADGFGLRWRVCDNPAVRESVTPMVSPEQLRLVSDWLTERRLVLTAGQGEQELPPDVGERVVTWLPEVIAIADERESTAQAEKVNRQQLRKSALADVKAELKAVRARMRRPLKPIVEADPELAVSAAWEIAAAANYEAALRAFEIDVQEKDKGGRPRHLWERVFLIELMRRWRGAGWQIGVTTGGAFERVAAAMIECQRDPEAGPVDPRAAREVPLALLSEIRDLVEMRLEFPLRPGASVQKDDRWRSEFRAAAERILRTRKS